MAIQAGKTLKVYFKMGGYPPKGFPSRCLPSCSLILAVAKFILQPVLSFAIHTRCKFFSKTPKIVLPNQNVISFHGVVLYLESTLVCLLVRCCA